jgi:hypothetical protein
MADGGIFRPGMRGYIVPLVSGLVLTASAFLPWVRVEDVTIIGFPDTTALWIIGLGLVASILALLSLITRKNSRHPLLLVGLLALGLMFLSWRLMPKAVADRALMHSQAIAIVDDLPMIGAPDATVGVGIYLGLFASMSIAAFGLTIVLRRVAKPYVAPVDDDV